MSSKVKLSPEDQVIFWFSTAPTEQAEALFGRVKGVLATRRKASRQPAKKKVNSAKAVAAAAVAVHRNAHEGATSDHPAN